MFDLSRAAIVAGFAACVIPSDARAGAAELYAICDPQSATHSAGACGHRVLGILEGLHVGALASAHTLTETPDDIPSSFDLVGFCTPEGFDTYQLASVVRVYLRDNPKDRDMPAAVAVLGALRKEFRCPE